jgi:dolichyl-phosphate beta-glucosyltransferase
MSPFSLIVPAFEEAERLSRTLEVLKGASVRLGREVEILVVDDGSSDQTAAVAAACDGVRVIRLSENRGKGVAVSAGVRAASHELIAFTDADCPYDLQALEAMFAAIERGDCEVAIGSRELADSEVNLGYGWMRRFSGQIFSFLTWLVIGLPFRDSQCGLKAFRASTAQKLFAMRTIEGFGFDFEILAAALTQGDRVLRFPVRLTHSDDSRIRLVRDSLRMASDLWRVRRALRRRAYDFQPDDRTEHPCPLCGEADFEPVVAKDGFRMVACRGCRLWYLNPMPSEALLASLYDRDYFANSDSLSAGYENYGTRGEDFREAFAHRLASLPSRVAGGRLLDVGAGFGYLLDAAQGKFSECWAVERSPDAVEVLQGKGTVRRGTLAEVDLPDSYFDVVSLQDCLEHFRDPREALMRIREVLRPGGCVLLVTPNTDSLLAKFQRRSWVSLKFPEHVVLFQRATLTRILEEAGFEVETQVPAGQYARLDFLVSRVLSGYPRLAVRAQAITAKVGGARVRFWVGSGSLLVVASRPSAAKGVAAVG